MIYNYDFDLEILHYNLKIVDLDNKDIYLNAFLDTGNFLINEDNIPIIILNDKFKDKINIKYCFDYFINTVLTNDKLKIYEVKSFFIKINGKYIKKDVYIGFGKIKHQAIIGLSIIN